MADFIFNISKGKIKYYAEQVGVGNAALVVIPIEASGVEADSVLRDYDTVQALLAASNNEQSTMGRKIVTTASVTVDDTDDRLEVDIDDITWVSATGNPVSDLLIAFDPDTTSGSDADLVPVSFHDFPVTPDGSNVTVNITDIWRAS